MGQLPFPPDAELTGPDRLVLSILQKEYELHEDAPPRKIPDAAEDSDDSATKHTEFVVPSPAGKLSTFCTQCTGSALRVSINTP
jgi:hypothetical protein